MNTTILNAARLELVARGRRLLRTRCRSDRSPHGRRSETFDDLTPDEVKSLSTDDMALLVAIRRSISRIASNTYGTCRRCAAPIELERLSVRPELDRCSGCTATRPSPKVASLR